MARIRSTERMSNRAYHRSAQPYWWARVGDKFLDLDCRHRGDKHLDTLVDVPIGVEVLIGCGRGRDSVRETVVAEPIEEPWVVVEVMPECHRETHRRAGDWGSYPHNGSARYTVPREIGERRVAEDNDGYDHIVNSADPDDYRRCEEVP